MIKRMIPIILVGIVALTGCSNKNINYKKVKVVDLEYSNLVDEKTQKDVERILIKSGINKNNASYFNFLVNEYNKKSEIKKFETSKDGFVTIDKQQVPYDEAELGDKWDYKKLNYMDFNCRLTAFKLFEEYIKSDKKFNGEESNLMFDIDAIKNNPVSKFSKDETNTFINLYASIPVEKSKNISKHADAIIKEWEKRKISFLDNKNISMINVFLHFPEDGIVFVGHAGVLVNNGEGLLFIEKYGASMPFQVSKFKDKSELKTYLMDRLDVNTADNGASKPIIMENNKLMDVR